MTTNITTARITEILATLNAIREGLVSGFTSADIAALKAERAQLLEGAAIEDRAAKHTFGIEIAANIEIRVDANNRAQAASRAKKAGHTVRSVNMIG